MMTKAELFLSIDHVILARTGQFCDPRSNQCSLRIGNQMTVKCDVTLVCQGNV